MLAVLLAAAGNVDKAEVMGDGLEQENGEQRDKTGQADTDHEIPAPCAAGGTHAGDREGSGIRRVGILGTSNGVASLLCRLQTSCRYPAMAACRQTVKA